MNQGYQAMRDFWLDVNNLRQKKEVPTLGERSICVAGAEMAAADDNGKVKNLFIAASSLGNASVYFENNSPSGLGGFTGGASSGPVREKALLLMQAAATVAAVLKETAMLPEQKDVSRVTLFAVSKDGKIYASEANESEVRNPEHPLYPFFAYTQQLFGAFRAEQEKSVQTAKPQPSAAPEDKKTNN